MRTSSELVFVAVFLGFVAHFGPTAAAPAGAAAPAAQAGVAAEGASTVESSGSANQGTWPSSSAVSSSFTVGITGDVNLNPKLSRDAPPTFVWGDTISTMAQPCL
jgi:hypothetical protein